MSGRYILVDGVVKDTVSGMTFDSFWELLTVLNGQSKHLEELKNQIDELEDDNTKYYKSLDKLEDYTKRFIPTKCTNEFKDCKTNRYYWLDHEGNFTGALELLNLMDCENEQLKLQSKAQEKFVKEMQSLMEKLLKINKRQKKENDELKELIKKVIDERVVDYPLLQELKEVIFE